MRFVVKTAHRQAVANILHWKDAHPPRHSKNKKVRQAGKVTQAGKVYFCDQKYTLPAFYLLHKALWKATFGQTRAHLGRFWPYCGSKKSRKLQGEPAKPRPKCVKITQKWGLVAFWTV